MKQINHQKRGGKEGKKKEIDLRQGKGNENYTTVRNKLTIWQVAITCLVHYVESSRGWFSGLVRLSPQNYNPSDCFQEQSDSSEGDNHDDVS